MVFFLRKLKILFLRQNDDPCNQRLMNSIMLKKVFKNCINYKGVPEWLSRLNI